MTKPQKQAERLRRVNRDRVRVNEKMNVRIKMSKDETRRISLKGKSEKKS